MQNKLKWWCAQMQLQWYTGLDRGRCLVEVKRFCFVWSLQSLGFKHNLHAYRFSYSHCGSKDLHWSLQGCQLWILVIVLNGKVKITKFKVRGTNFMYRPFQLHYTHWRWTLSFCLAKWLIRLLKIKKRMKENPMKDPMIGHLSGLSRKGEVKVGIIIEKKIWLKGILNFDSRIASAEKHSRRASSEKHDIQVTTMLTM